MAETWRQKYEEAKKEIDTNCTNCPEFEPRMDRMNTDLTGGSRGNEGEATTKYSKWGLTTENPESTENGGEKAK